GRAANRFRVDAHSHAKLAFGDGAHAHGHAAPLGARVGTQRRGSVLVGPSHVAQGRAGIPGQGLVAYGRAEASSAGACTHGQGRVVGVGVVPDCNGGRAARHAHCACAVANGNVVGSIGPRVI